ncbi:WecB/TagA/CpsF family glycosyltransferase [Amphritea pacifica]|uniref:WecB/TagA/CpsF family glycosyltransferase n=1 Tax=Amphritea pacifica TaxID=2811233 RepID=UPI001966CC5A|nr:WecB/TagA/CpsF family glycosyltransferase [Amphritea pacifica]MBN1008736.1 WecB/TagA/CpsF family glycosyltransferase [Amphritea pacifica]
MFFDRVKVLLFDLSIFNTTLKESSSDLIEAARCGFKQKVFFVNAHCINVAVKDASYKAALQDASILYADGSGMRLAAKIYGESLRDNVNGTDLFPMLCRDAAAAGVSIALLGAKPGIAERCAQRMQEQFPGLQIVWTHHGYLRSEHTQSVIESLNNSGASMLFVAMGVPAQELWIMRHADELKASVILGVGALFDFYSGEVSRAPLFLRKRGLEWLYRFLLEPKRMFSRYIIGNPRFILRTLLMRRRH